MNLYLVMNTYKTCMNNDSTVFKNKFTIAKTKTNLPFSAFDVICKRANAKFVSSGRYTHTQWYSIECYGTDSIFETEA